MYSHLPSWVWMLAFLGLASPGIYSYAPYTLRWDDAFYAHRIVCMNREFYNFNVSGMADCLTGAHKSPAIQLVGLPFGPAGATETGIGLAFVGLALFNCALALLTYRVGVRAGIAPWSLALAAACIGLTPLVRENGGALGTDVMVAWCSALTVMLIALEFRTQDDSALASFWRGGLWAATMMLGSLTKMTFAPFAAAAGPVLLYGRWRRCGRRALWHTVLGTLVFATPGLLVWVLCGPVLVYFGLHAAFSETAALWSIPGMHAGAYFWRFFSDLGLALVPLAALLMLFLRGIRNEKVRALPGAIVLGYLLIAAMGQNREPRYTLTVAVALPLALSWTSFRPAAPMRWGAAPFLGGLLAGLLLAVPMVSRPRLTPIRHVGDLLHELSHGHPTTFVISTDGPEYNIETFQLARQIGGASLRPVYLDTLVYDAINKRTIEDGYQRMTAADYVLFLKPEVPAGPEWSRQWAALYRAYAEQHGVVLASQTSREFDVFAMKRP